MKNFTTISQYMKSLPKEKREKLEVLRLEIQKLVPAGQEVIRYGMPTVRLYEKNLVHYAAMKNHIGFYPSPSGVLNFEKELLKRGIDFSKGCIRFSYAVPLPISFILKIVKFRIEEEKNKTAYS